MNFDKTFEEIMKPVEDDLNFVLDECELGSSCPIHIRQDFMELDGVESFIVTYHGEYAITTRRSPDSTEPYFILGETIGFIKMKHMLTAVLYLGSEENSIEQSNGVVSDGDAIRWMTFHENGDDGDLTVAHFDIVEMVRNGEIDVTKGMSEQDMQKLAEAAITKMGADGEDW